MSADNRLEFPIETVPKSGSSYVINEHVRWVRMPLPMSLNHINLWALGLDDNLTLVDTGMHLDDTKTAWTELLKSENLSIKDVIVTHMHPGGIL